MRNPPCAPKFGMYANSALLFLGAPANSANEVSAISAQESLEAEVRSPSNESPRMADKNLRMMQRILTVVTTRFIARCGKRNATPMRETAARFSKANASTAWVAACVFFLQLLLSGAAIGASATNFSDSVVCSQAQQEASKSSPAALAHRHLSCCLLHHGAAVDPTHRVSIAHVEARTPTRLLEPIFAADILGPAPEVASLSARAPPGARF